MSARDEAAPARGRYRKPPELAGLGQRHAVVEASAGTGKTYLLEHLVVDLLLTRGASIEQILVVTFTEKATAELVDRVRRKLEQLEALRGDDPNCATPAGVPLPDDQCWIIDEAARRQLRQAIFGFDRASISTIHAFCQRLLAEHAFANRRLFDEEAIDEEQAFQAAFSETLRRDVAPDPALSPYLELWLSQGGGLWGLRRALLTAARKLSAVHRRGDSALQPAASDAAIVSAGRAFLAVPTGHLKDALKRDGIHHSTAKALITRVEQLRAALEPCAASDQAVDWLRALAPLERKLCKELSEKLEDQAASPALADLRAAFARLEDSSSVLGVVVARLLPAFQRRLEGSKREAGRFDFQDMLTLVARSLEGEGERQRALLASLRARYRYALIDEFQDTDEVQWSIFRRIFFESEAGHVLTVIGDPKQAIYSFRGADVHTYLQARGEIEGAGGQRLHLTANFRSSQPVIAAYNAVLDDSAPFFRAAGGIHYDHPVACGRPELTLVDAAGAPAPGVVVLDVVSQLPSLLTYQVKAALLPRLAREMADILRPGAGLRFGPAGGDPAALPPVRAGDIYVLTRTTRESREVGEALREAGVPFAYFKQEKLFGTVEAREVLDLLRAIADPDDVTARGRAFITPFFGLSLVDLAACDDLDAGAALYRRLHHWRALADGGDFEGLFAELIDGSGVVCRELFFRDSERSLTNYLHLIEMLQEEAARSRATISELAQLLGAYINGTRRPPGEARDIQRLETDADAVQIMTIHHAKGLEAKVVFIYGGFWPGPYADVRAFHDQDGQRLVRVGRPSPADKLRYELEQDDEERRVLYVALTRAKARLYLPRFPPAFKKLMGAYRFIDQRLHALLGGFSPEASLFQRVEVPAPVAERAPVTDAPAALLASWKPPAELLAAEPDLDAQPRALAQARAGFVMTSYSAIKRRQGGLAPTSLESDDPSGSEVPAPTGVQLGSAPLLPDDELPRGRLSGLFLHEVLEELPLYTLQSYPDLPSWAGAAEVAALFERKRQRHDQRQLHLPHAQRMVHTALTAPLALGEQTIAGLASAERTLREMEFIYPIPERGHPLLLEGGALPGTAAPDGRAAFRIQRGAVKGYIDLLFQHDGRTYLCDWKGDWLPSWHAAELEAHCQRNYAIQAQLYTLAALRFLGVEDEAGYQARFGGVVYAFLRAMRPDDPRAGLFFQRPSYDEVRIWQEAMLGERFWRLTGS